MTMSMRPRAVLAALVGLLASLLLMTPPADAASQVTIATHNTWHGKAQVRPLADVIGWQEVDTAAGQQKLDALAGYATFRPRPAEGAAAAANAVPISWKRSVFEKTGSGFVRTHPGESGVTPSRFVTWVVLKHRESGKKLGFVNTHYISGAWSGKPARQQRWLDHNKAVKQVVADLTARGITVALSGDFNRHQGQASYLGLERFATPQASQVPYDQLYATRGHVVGSAERLQKFGSDVHFAWRGRVRL
ncbi:MAG: hypothetical protein PGN07_11640 [Aeromicrobium erythreum]